MTDGAEQLILATGSYDHSIKLWQAHTGNCIKSLQHNDSQVNALEITPDKLLLGACGYQHIRMYDICTNAPVTNFEGVSKNVTSLGFQEDGKWMYTGGEDGQLRLWEIRTQAYVKGFDCHTAINALCLHPNQIEIAIGLQSGAVYLWDVSSIKYETVWPEVDTSIQDVAISPDGMHMAAINNKGNCYIWSLLNNKDGKISTMQPKQKFKAHEKYGLKCKFSPDSSLLVTTAGDATTKLWKTDDFSLWRELKVDNSRWIWDAAFSADSQYLFTASSDSKARLWKLDTKEIEREYISHQKAITALAFRDEIVT